MKTLVSLAFVGGVLEVTGMIAYLLSTDQAALQRLVRGGVTPPEVVSTLLASPDRLAVAGGLAVLAAILVFAPGESGGHSHADGDVDDFGVGGFDGGGFGGDGGDGGGGGGGGGGE